MLLRTTVYNCAAILLLIELKRFDLGRNILRLLVFYVCEYPRYLDDSHLVVRDPN